VPGELLSLDSYVAMPLAGLMGWRGRLGILLIALAFLLALRDVQRDLASGIARRAHPEANETRAVGVSALMHQVWIFAILGAAASLFMPLSPAERLGMSGAAGIATDALVFWLKVVLADQALWLAEKNRLRLCSRLPWAQVLLTGLGALCILLM
jgi:hypothetical protein